MVYGPAQIEALINQDPAIAQQFTLWDQAGSSVVRGKMIILPIGNSVLFIQPVYLKSTSRVKIPELQRIIMSDGQYVVMETSLDKAYNLIKHRETEERERIGKRLTHLNLNGENTLARQSVEKKNIEEFKGLKRKSCRICNQTKFDIP